MFRSEYEKEIKNIPLSNDAISRRICDMSADTEGTVVSNLKESKIFAMQVDESTDISGEAQLLAFFSYVNRKKDSRTVFLL